MQRERKRKGTAHTLGTEGSQASGHPIGAYGKPRAALKSSISKQAYKGIPKGEAEKRLDAEKPIRFPLGPSGESENHTGGSRRLFAYFLVGEKV